MIKTADQLKQAFADGATPNGADFADLIDSFMPRDAVSDDDLAALRAMLVWWRTQAPGVVPAAPPPTPVPTPVPAPAPETGAAPAAPIPVPAGDVVVTAPANGNWSMLDIRSANSGVWMCDVATIAARPGFHVVGHAIASSGADGNHLVQNMNNESRWPWRTLQFAWQAEADGQFRLALRARRNFGSDSKGNPAQIACRIRYEAGA